MRTKLIALLAFAGLFVMALTASATTWLPNDNVRANMDAMGVLAPGLSPHRAAIEQNAANPVGGQAVLDDWPVEYQITNTTDSSYTGYGNGHKVVFSAGGVGHLIWVTHNTKNVYALHYKRFYPSTGWTPDTVLSSLGPRSNSVIQHASIALDANGTDIHVVWTGQKHLKQCYYHTFYLKCVPSASGNGGWIGTPFDVCTNHTEYAHCDPAVACAPGRVVVTWHEVDEDGSAIGFREFASNKWQSQVQLEGLSTYRRSLSSVSAAANGDVSVAYYGTQAGQPNSHIYVLRRVGGTWQTREDATAAFPSLNFNYADIDASPTSSNPHIVCHGWDTDMVFRIYHTYRSAGGWQTPEVIPGSCSDTTCDDVQPSMFFDGAGKAHVVWYEYNRDPIAQRGIEYSFCAYEGGSWSTSWLTSDVSSYVQWPNVTVSSTGAGFAIWTKVREPGSYQVWGRTLPAGSFGAPEPDPLADRVEVERNAANPVGGGTGQDGWGEAAAITNNRLENVTYYNNAHKVVYDADGVGHLVWYDNAGDAVYYKRFYPASGWSGDLQLAKTAGEPNPAIALDANGKDIHVVWRMWKHVGNTNFHIYYWKCRVTGPGTGGWVGKAMDLCENTGHDHANPSIACGPNGQVVVAWTETLGYPDWVRAIGFREYASGKWETQQQISDPSPCYRWLPSIATHGSGDVSVAYYGTQSDLSIFHVYANRRLGTAWRGWEDATPTALPDTFVFADLDVNPTTGNPHIVCHSYSIAVSQTNPPETTRYFHIYHSYSPSPGIWTLPKMISEPEVPTECAPSMFFAANGSAHVVWHGSDPDGANWGIKYASCPGDGGPWTGPYRLTSNATGCIDASANITVGLDGTLHVVWTRNKSTARYPYQIWGMSGTVGSGFSGLAAEPTKPSPGLTLDVSPNPLSRGAMVSYSLPAAANVSLRLYDIRGALVRTLACGHEQSGRNAVNLSGLDLPRGAYILRLQSNAGSLTRKLVIE